MVDVNEAPKLGRMGIDGTPTSPRTPSYDRSPEGPGKFHEGRWTN